MKLSIWSSYFSDLSPEDATLELANCDYHYCELSDEHAFDLLDRGDSKAVGQSFRCFAEKHGVTFLQGHLFLRAKICENRENVELLKKQLDLFDAIGIKNAVLHCDSMVDSGLDRHEIAKRNLDAIGELINHIQDTELVICLENLRAPSITRSVEDLLYFVDTLKSPHLGICLDTGHLNLSENPDQRYFIEKAGKHLKALHIADNEGGYDQHVMPFGRGSVNMTEVVRSLKEIGYDGLYNLEIPGEGKHPLEIRRYKLEYIKKVFAYLDQRI